MGLGAILNRLRGEEPLVLLHVCVDTPVLEGNHRVPLFDQSALFVHPPMALLSGGTFMSWIGVLIALVIGALGGLLIRRPPKDIEAKNQDEVKRRLDQLNADLKEKNGDELMEEFKRRYEEE
jgi:hypothetical protein